MSADAFSAAIKNAAAMLDAGSVDLGSSRRAKQNSGRTTYGTPQEVLTCLAKLGPIALDPCWHPTSLVRARLTFTKEQDGLRPWPTRGLIFVNWPYGAQVSPVWSNHCIAQARRGCEIVTLFPASTETGVYRAQLFSCSAMVHVEHRLKFLGETDPAMFGSALSYFGPRPTAFVEAFRSIAYPISSQLNRPVWRRAEAA
jgi:hypothetical protein